MAKYVGYKRPKNTKKAMKNLLRWISQVAAAFRCSFGSDQQWGEHCRHLSYPPGHQ